MVSVGEQQVAEGISNPCASGMGMVEQCPPRLTRPYRPYTIKYVILTHSIFNIYLSGCLTAMRPT